MSYAIDVIENLAQRAKGWYEEDGKWLLDAVERAIDDGLIYTEDILALLGKYMPSSEIANLFFTNCYEELVDDVAQKTKEIIKGGKQK